MGMRRLWVAVLAVVLVSLAGCSDDEPKADPAPKASVSESVVPKEETAEEFIRRWFQVQEDMQNSGDTTEFRQLSEGCKDCVALADRVDEIHDAGGAIRYGGAEVERAKARAGSTSFDVRLNVEPTTLVERAGGPSKRLGGGTETYVVTLAGRPGDWAVTAFLSTSRR